MANIQTCGYSHRKNGACEMTTLYALTPQQTQLLHDLIEAFDVWSTS